MKPNIALVTGGYSGEAVISYKTAITILQHIDTLKYNIYKIDITPNGWYYEASGSTQLVDKNDFSIQINSKKNVCKVLFINTYKFTKNSNVFTLSAKSVITGCCE